MSPTSQADLDAIVEAYEAEQERRGQADLSAFLPAPGHPRYGEVLRELVRVDLEYGWRSGRRSPRAVEPNRDRRMIPTSLSSHSCARSVASTSSRVMNVNYRMII